ncbi:hypothetical protein [Xanthomonas sacchari]|uniref:hypothetical protein n=1 Tax=Xanthomonas sacchari TaxID=56458 RepID=UPI00225220C2|nr:hypothetical protein [Xanthomonas sacchari]
MLEINNNNLVAAIMALQFATFGWRINREISVGDAGRRTWLPVPDILNVVSMLSVVAICVILPLKTGVFSNYSRAVLAGSFVLIAFYPLALAGHYRLFSRGGRSIYLEKGRDYPYCTGQEAAALTVATLLTVLAGWYVQGA